MAQGFNWLKGSTNRIWFSTIETMLANTAELSLAQLSPSLLLFIFKQAYFHNVSLSFRVTLILIFYPFDYIDWVSPSPDYSDNKLDQPLNS